MTLHVTRKGRARSLLLGPGGEHGPLPVVLMVFLVILLVMFPVGMVMMLSGAMTNDRLWMTSVFLGVQFLVTLTFALNICSVRPVLLSTALLIALSILVEFVGVTTGVPFGAYYYSYFLEPFVVGNVPLAISFAWFSLVVNSYFLLLLLDGSARGGLRTVVLTVLLVVGLDLALEPFAAYVNRYWRWIDGAIPLENFASWGALALVFAMVLSHFMVVKGPYRARRFALVPGLLLGLNLLQFVVINLVHGYWLLSLASLAVISGVLFISLRRRTDAV